jgi:hypothetical protein
VRIHPRLIYVDMKTRRAKFHLDALEVTVKDWIDSKPYTVTHYDDFEKAIHIVRIEDKITPELLPMLIGDFVCCLRAALDQLAWALAHLDSTRVFSEHEERRIQFPISKIADDGYRKRLGLFPSTVAAELDKLQPYHRGNAFGGDPLWQLSELWNMDKHRAIPCNSNSFVLGFPGERWKRYVRHLANAVEVYFPIVEFYESPMNLEPSISVEPLFGEHMGQFEIPMSRLREINQHVGNDMIPRFTRFFT